MTTTSILPLLIALLGGAALPLQSLINARLGQALQGASWAAAASAIVSAVALLALSPIVTGPPSVAATIKNAPAWIWFGGILGALYLFAAVYGVKHLGAAGLVATVVFGQLAGSLVLDSLGILHDPVALTWPRVLGCTLAFAGVWLVTMKA